MKKTIAIAILCIFSLALNTILHAIETEPNWTNRYCELKQDLLSQFHAPTVGQTITIVPRIGREITGRLDGIESNTVTIDGKTYGHRQLTDKTSDILFPESRATRIAREQIIEEREAFTKLKLAEQKKAQEGSGAERRPSLEPQKWPITHETTTPARVRPAIPMQTSEREPVSDSLLLWVFVALSALAVFFIVLKLQSAAKRKANREAMIGQANIFLSTVKSQKALKPIQASLILKPGEDAYLEDACALHEARSVRHYQSGGVGFRVAKGVYVGGSKGRSVSRDEMTCIDTGRLTITNKRLVFDGAANDRTIPIEKIVSINNYSDAIEISAANRQKSMYFTVPNPLIWYAAIKLLSSGQDPKSLDIENIDI